MKKIKKLDSLQVLRAIAALLVVMYHSNVFSDLILKREYLMGIFRFGYSGVDLFFVLSGFIIYYAHKNDFGNFSKLRPYLIKRFTRIYRILLVYKFTCYSFILFSPQIWWRVWNKTWIDCKLIIPNSPKPFPDHYCGMDTYSWNTFLYYFRYYHTIWAQKNFSRYSYFDAFHIFRILPKRNKHFSK